MSVQTRYGFRTQIGVAGGLVDLAPYAIDTFTNEEDNGKLRFGVGVVTGTVAGSKIKVPTAAATAATFEGITVNSRTAEVDMDGNTSLRKGASVNVIRYGRVYARIVDGIEPKPGDPIYLVTSGDDAGCFTNASGATAIAIKGRFISAADATGAKIAAVELFNQAQDVPASNP